MSGLLNLCASNYLSYDALLETINALGPRVLLQNPSCLLRACGNKKVTLKIVQLLYNTLPGALHSRDDHGSLPIHELCCNGDLDDTDSLDILRFMLEVDPNFSSEVVGSGWLPIHYAAQFKSTAFSKELIDAYPESLRVRVGDGWLPIHRACAYGNRDDTADTADTIQYMLKLDPELINAEDREGSLPIHITAMRGMTKLIELLLKYDPNAASKEINDGSRRLPLHLACNYNKFSSIQVLYDAYPDAILASDGGRQTPLDIARSNSNQSTVDFLQTQLVYARHAQDMAAMTTVDVNSRLPLHHALNDNVPLGSIKLLLGGNPAALQVADQKGAYPVHIACKVSSVKVAKYLVDLDGDNLNNIDANEDSPLHYACRGGNLNVVNYLLEANVPSVSERNNKNKLAIHLLLECGENTLDRDSMEYVETVRNLLLANPEVVRDFMPY